MRRDLLEKLARETGLPPLLLHLLINRGVEDPQEIHRHLNPNLSDFPDPFLLPDMEKAVGRIIEAPKKGEKIAIYGDYDVDGTTGAAILYLFLKELGFEPLVVFPHREKDGYGLHAHLLPPLKEQGVSLLISVDCGISAHEACRVAKELGIDVIVTDHHEVGPEIPEAFAVINPKRPESSYPFRELAGVGVAFSLLRALRQRLYQEGFFASGEVPNLRRYLDLVALGTVADIVPLKGENRLIAYFGLKELERTERPGLQALKKVAGLENETLDTNGILFRLAPRINAGGRLKEAALAFRLLVTDDPSEAQSLAEELHRLNAERQRLEERILREAWEQIKNRLGLERASYVLASPDWPSGVIGIVASRLQEALYRPVILLSLGEELAKGSGRSIPEVNLYQCLFECREHLKGFGGHPAAAGLKLSKEDIISFAAAFEEVVSRHLAAAPPVRRLQIDAWVRLRHLLEPNFLENYLKLGPFGPEYPEPVFALRNFEVRTSTILKEKHLKFYLWQEGLGIPAVYFRFEGEPPLQIKALAASLDFSHFQGRQYIQLRVRDLKT
ncbi:MAG: single-stranded-DNA-specific exonuclease RecJ [Thermodesulfobacteria bacterium]|nr:single-stranded-DNA-specific exonuclease RecJ [Thermodesulfobacteriota bacterium]